MNRDAPSAELPPEEIPVALNPGEGEITAPAEGNGLLAPLKIPIFRALLIAVTVGNVGGQMRDGGTRWLMTMLSPSAFLVGLVSAMAYVPALFLMPLAGAVVDTCDRRKLLLFTQSMLSLSSASLAVFTFLGWVSPLGLLAFVTAIGVLTVFNLNGWQVVVHDVVPRHQLSRAVSLNSASFNAARSVGPALGGVVIAMAGPGAVFALNAVSFFGTIFVLKRWKEERAEARPPSSSVKAALLEGFHYLRSQRLIALLMMRNFVFIVAGMSVLALLPVLVRAHLKLGPREFGVLGTCFGCGAMVAALFAHGLSERFGIRAVTRFGIMTSIGTLFGIGVCTALHAPMAVFGALILPNGFSWTLVALNHNVRARMSARSEFSGRVLSYFALSGTGGMAVGGLLFGFLASEIGLSGAFLGAAALSLVALLLAIRHPMPKVCQE